MKWKSIILIFLNYSITYICKNYINRYFEIYDLILLDLY